MIYMRRLTAATLVWAATATLHKANPERRGFRPREIEQKVLELEPEHGKSSITIKEHITHHCVATRKPDSLPHRMLIQNEDDSYRLYRTGDPCHPGREHGKTTPIRQQMPATYVTLLDWYRNEFDARPALSRAEDPLLALRGLGKELWKGLGGGENFIQGLRSGWYPNEPV